VKVRPGQVAVVTGAASGIGRALAEAFLAAGLGVVLADVEEPVLQQTAAELAELGDVLAVRTDVSDAAQVDDLAARAIDRFGPLDIVCLNAGVVGARVPIWRQRPEDWEWVLRVNLWGVVNGLRSFVPHLVEQGHGHVVVTSSIAGLAPIQGGGNGPYVASKYAAVGLCETLRVELDAEAPQVGVTVLCPGPVATRIRSAARNRPGPATYEAPSFENSAASLEPEEVARQVLEAIDLDRFYLLPNPGTAAAVRARTDRLLAELPTT
jgi:NAD(P)-dependent dehydrogenase (short-subunit alcohol dehydrogenase family)